MFGSSARKAVLALTVGLAVGFAASPSAQQGAWTLIGNVLTYQANTAAASPAVRIRQNGAGGIAAFNYAGTDTFTFYQTYLNFTSTLGSTGYGIRNNAGVVEYKNSGGSWVALPSGGGVTSITGTANQITASAATGAVTLSMPAAIGNFDSFTFSGGQSLVGTTADTTILRRGSNGQSLFVANIDDGVGNFERASLQWSGNTLFIGSTAGGTGSSRNVQFTRGATNIFTFSNSIFTVQTNIAAAADGTLDIGTSAVKFRTGYFGTSVVVGNVNISTSSVSAASTGVIGFSGRGELKSPADGKLNLLNAAETVGVTLDFATDSTLKLFARDGSSAANLIAAGTITFASLSSSSGVNYVCSSTTGVLSKNSAACVGTDADLIASIPELRRQMQAMAAELVALRSYVSSFPVGVNR